MNKSKPEYKLVIYSNEATVTVTNPITCQFTVTRGLLSDNNKATIKLYNLAPNTRDKIFQDAYTIDWEKFKYVQLYAGYNGNVPLIFKGRILQAYSYKNGGDTDIITEIQAMALDIFDCQSSYTFKAGTSKKEALQTMVLDMPNVMLTNLGTLEGEFLTDTTFDGNTMENLSKLTGGNVFVDNGDLNCIETYEVIDVPVPVISDDSCLLGTPIRRDANIEIKTIFMPDIIVGQLLEINSRISPVFNGQFKVIGFTHDCMISETQAGNRTTSVDLWIGVFLPKAENQPEAKFQKVKGIGNIVPVNENAPNVAREVYRYIRRTHGNIPKNKICFGNITWEKMLGNNNSPADRYNECTLDFCINAYYTAKAVYELVTKTFKGSKPVVSSGWRSYANNRSCGGAVRSRHLYGLACDFVVSSVSVSRAYPKIASGWNGFSLNEGTWIHVQFEPRKGRANDK